MKWSEWLAAWPVVAAIVGLIATGAGMATQLHSLSAEVARMRIAVEAVPPRLVALEVSTTIAHRDREALKARVDALEHRLFTLEGKMR